jgi:hypothetical protein
MDSIDQKRCNHRVRVADLHRRENPMASVWSAEINKGLEAGWSRAEGVGLTGNRDELPRAQQLLVQVIDGWYEDLSPWFQQMLAEQVAVATCARTANVEPTLRYEEVLVYLAHASLFLDSFKCP